ncbi:MAG: TonB-dependent receptor [Acidobacteriota bacterium]|nr:TonB-dependent receptor [Acidobacteriota bacterium]
MRKSQFHYDILFGALIIILLNFTGSFGQEYRGTITGNITDPNGAIIPGAAVTVQNIETNVTSSVTTNDEGSFTFPLLLPGKYKLSATAPNFKTIVRESIQLDVGDRLTVDLKLEIGTTAEVTVAADTELVERGTVTTGTVITERQITELPLSEGAAYNLATQAPGVSYTGNPQFSGPTANGNLAAFRTNGASGNLITLDGSPNIGFDGGVAYTPPPDALTQFKIQTNAFDAQNGFTAGSTVNVAVKSGTNKLHGSAYYFNRPEKLTANNFFNNRLGRVRPPRSYYRVGGQINGPVYIPKLYNGKDKTFFMFSYERQKDIHAEPITLTVPTALMRTGNFSELLSLSTPILIYDPATAALRNTSCAAGSTGTTVCRTPFAGNIIPTARLNPAAVAFLNLYPQPNLPGVTNNYFSNQSLSRPYDSYLARIDHNFNSNHRIFGKFFYSKSNEDRYNFLDAPNSITQGFEVRTNKGGSIDYTATLSNEFVFDVRSSLNDFAQTRTQANPMSASALGFSGIAAISQSTVFPEFDFTNFTTLGAQRADYNEGLNRDFKLFSIQPTLTQIFGDHTLKYGYDYRRLLENRTTNGFNAGRFLFTGTYTAPASNSSSSIVNQVGRDLAAFLLGIPSASANSFIEQAIGYGVSSNYNGFFVQDDWRLTQKLTLNLGLRYELESGLRESNGQFVTGFDTTTASPLQAAALANFNASVPASVPAATFQNLTGGLKFATSPNDVNQATDKNNFQPRIGVSYALNDKTVLRGGFGIFTSPFQIQAINQNGFTASTTFTPSTNNGLTFLANINNPFPTGLNAAIGSSLGLNTSLGTTLGTTNATGPTATTVYDYNRKNANYARIIGGIQRQLPYNFGVEATVVYSHGYNLPVFRQLNYIPRQYLNDLSGLTDATAINSAITTNQTFLNALVANPFRGLVPQNASLNAATIQRRFLLTQFPQFQDLIVNEYNGTNNYASLQLQATKRLGQGLSFNAAYTYAHERERVRRLNPQDENLTEMISTFSRPHRIAFSSVYELPFGRGREYFNNWNPVVDAFLGGWQLNAVYEWQSGEPLVLQNVFYNGDLTQLKNMLGKSDGQGRRYGVDIPAFDTSGFFLSTGAALSFGNNYTVSSQNTLRSIPYTLNNFRNQPFQKFDVGLTKNFNFNERMKLQVRVEAINAFNWVYLGNGLQLSSTSTTFGFVSGQRNLPRDIQLGARFTF